MKYKIGDKVKIKTWEELEEEYGLNEFGGIDIKKKSKFSSFYKKKEKILNEKFPDRIVEIEEIVEKNDYYYMKDIGWYWTENIIKELVDPIKNRFQILDIR